MPLPSRFVYLKEIVPDIIEDMVYCGSHNFIGRPIPGYEKPLCITVIDIAERLKAIQNSLRDKGLSLKVFDAYRPQRAVNYFYKWSQDHNDQLRKQEYYPYIDKKDLFDLGFISQKSQHTRGCAVDLTLAKLLPGGAHEELDMGTRMDLFDETSYTADLTIPKEAQNNRLLLKDLMGGEGLLNYAKEWWHFYLKDEPFPETYFDFPIS